MAYKKNTSDIFFYTITYAINSPTNLTNAKHLFDGHARTSLRGIQTILLCFNELDIFLSIGDFCALCPDSFGFMQLMDRDSQLKMFETQFNARFSVHVLTEN